MNSFANIDRNYRMNRGVISSKKSPLPETQSTGFRPTYMDSAGKVVFGDPVNVAELNFIFNDLYAQANKIDQLLTAKGK
ncbi:TPA: hypothetical protein R4S87_001862 [Kluyvera cryocrescens]|nr:hypothetical protein [Kluyvera cryocrescens]